MSEFVFWHQIVSPHMAQLARALAAQGSDVTYVAGRLMSPERERLGWSPPQLEPAKLLLSGRSSAAALMREFPHATIHLTEGVRRNGFVRTVCRSLRRERRRWGALMETVDDRGWKGVLKRIDYERAFGSNARPDFFLPIGRNMPDWILARGVDAERIFPFAYFLDPRSDGPRSRRPGPFRFGFVGRFEQRKRLDLLICSLAILARREFEIVVIGAGPLENSLRKLAGARLNASKVHWLGQIERSRALTEIGGLDCLVLPSDHDGWGAVVSEALIAGVPAVCSDACGSAIAVEHSDVGGVFPRGDVVALAGMLGKMIDSGPVGLDQRERIVQWARCLTSEVGARYLESISRCFYDARPRPDPPWQPGREQSQTVRS